MSLAGFPAARLKIEDTRFLISYCSECLLLSYTSRRETFK